MTEKKYLVAYFSHRGENYVSGDMINLKVGNTEAVAKMISDYLQGELFEIARAKPYPERYRDLVTEAKAELKAEARPALVATVDNIEQYDLIFVGYPNWCGTMPMPVCTFLENCNLSGKTLAPFCTHEGSGLGESMNDLKKLCPNAKLLPGKAIFGTTAPRAGAEVKDWLQRVIE